MQLPPIGPGGPGGSEDCLYLNVTAPTGPTAATDAGRGGQRRPVMVWFHGGGFANGAGDLYRPQRLAVQGDAVVVTVNYRLGIFGLFGHPALGGAPTSPSPTNRRHCAGYGPTPRASAATPPT